MGAKVLKKREKKEKPRVFHSWLSIFSVTLA
jgi:hypothetical protein